MTRASDIMVSPAQCVLPTTSVASALGQLEECGFRHLPVTNSAGVAIGMVSRHDLVAAPGSRSIAEVMSPEVVVGRVDDDVASLARRLVHARVGAIPIVDAGGVVVGIVSVIDVLERLANPTPTSDEERCATCGREIGLARQRAHPWSRLCERCLDEQVYDLMTRE